MRSNKLQRLLLEVNYSYFWQVLLSEKINFQYKNGPAFSFPDISCANSENLLLLGESGKGKTTLLHLLSGLLSPTNGKVLIDGTDLYSLSSKERDRFRGENIGIVFQTPHFVESLTVLDNLLLPAFFTGKSIDKAKAISFLDRLNIADKKNKKNNQLSVGEQQRVAIARALMNEPKVLLADEPTSALDDKNASEVITLLEEQAKLSDAALIIVTHDNRLQARFSNKIVL